MCMHLLAIWPRFDGRASQSASIWRGASHEAVPGRLVIRTLAPGLATAGLETLPRVVFCVLRFPDLDYLFMQRSRSARVWRRGVCVRPNVRAKATVEADADWPRKDNLHDGLERPGGGCRSGSPLERGVRPHSRLCAANYLPAISKKRTRPSIRDRRTRNASPMAGSRTRPITTHVSP